MQIKGLIGLHSINLWCDHLLKLLSSICICGIHGFALDGFYHNTVCKLGNIEEKISAELGLEPEAAGWEAKIPLSYAVPWFDPLKMRTVNIRFEKVDKQIERKRKKIKFMNKWEFSDTRKETERSWCFY